MRRRVTWLFCTILFSGMVARGGHFTLVDDGQPRATIIVSTNAVRSTRFAAEELQRYVERISGARLPITNDTVLVEGPRILVGPSTATDALGCEIPSGFSRELNEEGFLLRVTTDALVLAGNDGGPVTSVNAKDPYSFRNVYKGSLFAVYELLERFGCRWFYPGDFGEVVPRHETLTVPVGEELCKPSFPVRGFWYGVPASKRKDMTLKHDMSLWMLRCRFLPYGSVLASAGDGSVMAPFRKWRHETVDGKREKINTLFEEHPEYFAMKKDGTRRGEYLCLANSNVVRIATDHAIAHFTEHPDAFCFGYAPPDGAPTCECSACQQHNTGFMQKPPADPEIQDISDGFYRFLNQVAAGVAQVFPEKWITTTAYSGRIRPPEGMDLHPNISAHTAFLGHSLHHRYDFTSWQTTQRMKLYERWGRMCRFMVERPYFPPFQFHCHVPQPMYRAHAFNIRQIRALGFRGSEWEGRCAFAAGGLNYYVRAKCLWDADIDIDRLLEDYYTRFFGAAAEPVQAFFEQTEHTLTLAPVDHHEEERLPEIYPHERVVEITDAVGDIEARVADADPATRQRVRFARLIVDHFRAYSDMRDAEAKLDLARAAAKARVMIAEEREIEAMHPALIDGYAEHRDSGALYGELGANASPHGKLKQYEAKQALIDGSAGERVAVLPVEWEFATDPHDDGLVHQWYLSGEHGQTWRPMLTTVCYEAQGLQDEALHGYNGLSWYRTTFTVPRAFEGRRVILFAGGVSDQAWYWCNGRLAGSQPFHPYWQRWRYHHEVDLTDHVKPGETNTLAVRIFDEQNLGGIFRRCFLYSPVVTVPPPE